MKTFKLILSLIAIGVWILVLQNTGIIPITHRVRVINEIDANITNAVDANVSGSVNVNNTVDVNIHAINGYNRIPYFHMDICFLWIIGNNANTFQIEYAITETIPLMV